MDKTDLISYWVSSADRDFETMDHLFKSGDYTWALFVGHLVIEKLIKALYVKQISPEVPQSHNLPYLAEKSNLTITNQQRDHLILLTSFNKRAISGLQTGFLSEMHT
ncbi:MAG: HEPN domain-containing protein [Chitinivibrionales bacterium]|nr:HEPN domain-containing protein [Chitinivibrionales bacterium]